MVTSKTSFFISLISTASVAAISYFDGDGLSYFCLGFCLCSFIWNGLAWLKELTGTNLQVNEIWSDWSDFSENEKEYAIRTHLAEIAVVTKLPNGNYQVKL